MSDNPNVSQSDLQQAFESYHQIILPYLGGSGSGGSTYTLLFEGTAPTNLNTNNLTSSSASVELSDSIEHYEFIEIFFQSQEPFNTQGSVYAHGIMPVSAITPLYTICTFETSEGFVESSYTYFSRQSWGFYDSTHISRCWESYSGWSHNANHLIVYGIKSGNVGNNLHQYSTEEQVVGTWIDGRPVYEKTVVRDNITTYEDGNPRRMFNATDLIVGISTLISCTGNFYINQGTYYQGNSYFLPSSSMSYNAGTVSATSCGLDNGNLNAVFQFDKVWGVTNVKVTVTAKYTKTTDTPSV